MEMGLDRKRSTVTAVEALHDPIGSTEAGMLSQKCPKPERIYISHLHQSLYVVCPEEEMQF
jgi:hypothetical protein